MTSTVPSATDLSAHLQRLEERLLQPEFRQRIDEVALLLTDDFREFGSSGRAYTKPEVLQALATEPSRRLSLASFHCQVLAPGVALVTYRSELASEPPAHALRSSLWVLGAGGWRMAFHQGTPISLPGA